MGEREEGGKGRLEGARGRSWEEGYRERKRVGKKKDGDG